MDIATFSQQIVALSHEVAGLRASRSDPSDRSFRGVFAQLEDALVELRAAEDELRQQNLQLQDSQDALEVERQRWHTLFDIAPDGYLVTDLNGIIVTANQAASVLLGAATGELVGTPLVVFIPPDHRREFFNRLQELSRRGTRNEWEMDLLRHHGSQFPATVRVVAFQQEHRSDTAPGRPAELAWMIHNISNHRRIEHELGAARDKLDLRVQERTAQLYTATVALEQARRAATQNEEHFRLALANSPIVVFTQDRELRYTWVYNPHPGLVHKDVLGKTDLDLFSPTDAEQVVGVKRSALASGVAQRAEVRVTINGEVLYYDLAVEPLRDPAGQIIGITCVAVDITERKGSAEQLRTQADDLQNQRDQIQRSQLQYRALTRRLAELQERERSYVADQIYNAAGQLLAALRLQLFSLERTFGSDVSIGTQLAETQQTLDRLMGEMHRLAGSLHPAVLDRLGLASALKQELAEFSESYGLQEQFVATGLDGMRMPAEVETTLYRIVQDGLRNVAQHARATYVGLILSRVNSRLVLTLEDDGVGFDQSLAEHTGGLGLVSMRERVEAVGGELTVESKPGGGTTVVARVPIKDAGLPGSSSTRGGS